MVLSGYLAASQQEVPTKKYVVAFADIVGSTRLYESAGDDLAKALVTGIQSEIAAVVSRAGGVVHEIVGDEVMFLFDDVNPGVACACQLQQAVESFSAARGLRISVRIGLHFGPAIMDQGRLFGDTVNTAARMAGIARGGQIVVTQAVVEDLTGIRRTLVRRFDQVRVKGKAEELVVFDLLWRLTNVTEIRPASVPVSERALGLNATLQRTSSSATNSVAMVALSTFQSLTLPSVETTAGKLPSGDRTARVIRPPSCGRVPRGLSPLISQMRTRRSLALTSPVPSGVKANDQTAASCAASVLCKAPSATFHSRT